MCVGCRFTFMMLMCMWLWLVKLKRNSVTWLECEHEMVGDSRATGSQRMTETDGTTMNINLRGVNTFCPAAAAP